MFNNISIKDIRKHLTKVNNDNIVIDGINHSYEQSNSYNKSPNSCNKSPNSCNKSPNLKNIYESLLVKQNIDSSMKSSSMKSSSMKPNKKTETPSIISDNIYSLTSIFNDSFNEYYIFRTEKNNSFLHSILLNIDNSYRMLYNKNGLKQKRMEISSEAYSHIKGNDKLRLVYKQKKININNIPIKLFGDCIIERDNILKSFLSDYFNVKILIYNTTDKQYYYIKNFCENDFKTLVFIEHKSKYEPILNCNGKDNRKLIEYIINNSKEYEDDNIVLKSISNYKIKELRDIAIKLNIPINYSKDGKVKKKLKSILYNDIKITLK